MTDAPTDAQLWLVGWERRSHASIADHIQINTTYCENAGQLLKQIELCFKTVKDAKILYRLEYMHGFL